MDKDNNLKFDNSAVLKNIGNMAAGAKWPYVFHIDNGMLIGSSIPNKFNGVIHSFTLKRVGK